MNSNQHIWRVWVNKAYRWGVGDWAADFLEAAGPLATLGAQAIYLVQPFLSPILPEGHLEALAEILEEPDQTRAFALLLREGSPQ